jgi:alpha-L-fucosidase
MNHSLSVKKINFKFLVILLIGLCISCAKKVQPPLAIGPLPSERQLTWYELEYYGFLHFNMNTFTNIEWGMGSESPETFNPTALDTRQWARVAKEAGMKGLIITAKHHDGFCLWPSKYTAHSVINSPWKDGKGDVLRDLSEACKEYGLKFGVYLSPWDRNHADYGTPEYVDYFRNQLRELLTEYGDIFEVWFDGANGGSGFYGGANETRKVDKKTYYGWEQNYKIVRELQPNAVIFGDGGPDVRWVGNESGYANPTNWSILRRDEFAPGIGDYHQLTSGHEDGTHWLPAEVDVSIRPGWYYHPYEDHKVKSLPRLLDIYYQSVGRNASLLLNLPIDRRGLVHEKDVEQLNKLARKLKEDFSNELIGNQKIEASNVRGNSSDYAAFKTIDGDKNTYWSTDDGITDATLTVIFNEPTSFNRFLVQEYIQLGQRVQQFSLEAEINGSWEKIAEETTIGYKRILRFETVIADKVRFRVLKAKGSPVIATMEMYLAPSLLVPPEIHRNKNGELEITAADKNVEIYYTLDGSVPNNQTFKYNKKILIDYPCTINSICFDPSTNKSSEIASQVFDISKKNWKVLHVSSGDITKAKSLIDGDYRSWWTTAEDQSEPQEVVIDLGAEYNVSGFTYWPMQERWVSGVITHYEFFVSPDNNHWEKASEGEFGNIWNNLVEQKINFDPIKGRYIKLKAAKIHGGGYTASIGEIGVKTTN